MSDDLYRDIIVEHSQHPRHHGELAAPDRTGRGDNPLCGDKIEIDLAVEDDRITAVAIRCVGCAISTASASLMASRLEGLALDEARSLFERVHALVTHPDAMPDDESGDDWGELAALTVVRRYPMRVKCATLAWHVLRQALEGGEAPVSTE